MYIYMHILGLLTVACTAAFSDTQPDDGHKIVFIEEYPYMAAILYKQNVLLGSGAIIGPRWILLTTFQLGAFKSDQLMVRVGSNMSTEGGQLLDVAALYRHEELNVYDNDVALLFTASYIEYNESVQPIDLATENPETGLQASVTSWTNNVGHLEAVTEDILDVSQCQMFYPDAELSERNICAMGSTSIRCKLADCGNPLVVNSSLIGHYIGGACTTRKPSLFSNVISLSTWINHTMEA